MQIILETNIDLFKKKTEHYNFNDAPKVQNNLYMEKSKITKILNSEENPIGKFIITWQIKMTKQIKNE